jgi:hypothetical protein
MSDATDIAERDALLKSLEGLPIEAPFENLAEAAPEPPAEPSSPPDSSSAAAHAAGAPASAAATPAEPPPSPPDDDPRSPFAKSRDRAAKTWAEIEAEKTRLTEERKALDADRARIAGQEAKNTASTAAPKYRPEQYETLARQFDAEGRDDMARIARDEAARLREEAQQARIADQRDALTKAWRANLTEQIKKHPELNDPASELHKRVDALLKSRPVLFSYAEGIDDAVEAIRSRLDADGAEKVRGEKSALENEVAALKRQLTEKERLLQPAKGGPPAPAKPETFDDLSLDQQRAVIVRELQAADAGA